MTNISLVFVNSKQRTLRSGCCSQSTLAGERQWQLIVSFDPSEMPVVMALEMAVTLMAAFEGRWTRRWFAESD